ncbi:ABC transporter ATP-binding protein [Oscillospiraceae bacterium]|nr:ABC transporter ATP-binding protein [Oscillospiraceae bacterium]BDF73586.1 ABC transporter ATP-binding protein [Oscillospiraceae bacterium]
MENQLPDREALLSVRGLKKYFSVKGSGLFEPDKKVKAVDDISFDLPAGKTLGLVGESGCGKSTLGRAVLRLIEPTGGSVFFEGQDVLGLGKEELRKMRRHFQIVFQDPYASLNPRMTIGEMVEEPFLIQHVAGKKEAAERAGALLETVGLRREFAGRHAHEFSGGQRQRISIARALALNPKLLVCDESVSALDVSVQAQIINMMMRLQRERHLAYLFISHDLRVVRHISDTIAVMYLGKVVEMADSEELFSHTMHPYSHSLLSAIPAADPHRKRERAILCGDVPSPVDPPSGCRFHTRCAQCQAICREQEPELRDNGGGHYCACHFAGQSGV